MTNQLIKRYKVQGTFQESKLLQVRETQRRELLAMMKDEGFVPVFDLDPVWEQSWVKDDVYSFTYTWQAVWAGEGKAWQIDGNSGGKMIPSSPKNK